MNIDSNLAIICITENGKNLAIQIQKYYENAHIYIVNNSNKFSLPEVVNNVTMVSEKLSELTTRIFKKYESILFIMATGIVVRTISSLIESKLSDPAILVTDEKGNNMISLLSGHVGGANELTLKLSEIINANPVITTATDVNNKSSLDNIAKKLDGYIANFRENVKEINSMIVNNHRVGIYVDGDYEIDTRGFEVVNSIEDISEFKKVVVVTNKQGYLNDKFTKLVPRDIVLGIGCRRNIDFNHLEQSINDFLDKNNIDINAIKEIGSIDIKSDEKAIIKLSKKLNVPFRIVSSEEISKIEDLFDKSEFVKKQVGVYNVSEPVAHILSQGNVIVKKSKYNGITISMGRI